MLCTIVIILMIELETLTLSPFHHNSDHVTVADEMIMKCVAVHVFNDHHYMYSATVLVTPSPIIISTYVYDSLRDKSEGFVRRVSTLCI